MILSEIRTMITGFGVYLDHWAADAPTATQLTASVNWSIRLFARKLHLFDPRITFNLNPLANTNGAQFQIRDTVGAAAGIYTVVTPATAVVSKRVIKPYAVYIGGTPLKDYQGEVGLWSMSQLNQENPSWPTENTGSVKIAVYLGNGRLLLSQPPSAAGSNNFISGEYIPNDLVVTTDDANPPDLPEELHEALAFCAAARVALPTATEQEQWARIGAYNKEWEQIANEIALENMNAINGPWLDTGWKYGSSLQV